MPGTLRPLRPPWPASRSARRRATPPPPACAGRRIPPAPRRTPATSLSSSAGTRRRREFESIERAPSRPRPVRHEATPRPRGTAARCGSRPGLARLLAAAARTLVPPTGVLGVERTPDEERRHREPPTAIGHVRRRFVGALGRLGLHRRVVL